MRAERHGWQVEAWRCLIEPTTWANGADPAEWRRNVLKKIGDAGTGLVLPCRRPASDAADAVEPAASLGER